MGIKWHMLVFGVILTVSGVSAGKCIVCDSSSNEKCKTEPSTITGADCSTECFTLVENDGKIKRGCVSDSGEKCTTKNCRKCNVADSACNTQVNPFVCKLCKSSENSNCASWKNLDSIINEICDEGISNCVTEITDDKHTSRRCATKDEKECPSGKKCSMCKDTGCNTGIFPSDRRKCYQCKSTDTKCAKPDADVSSVCLLYEESEKCYEYGSSDTTMSRGCKSDATEYQKCSSETPKDKCKECDTDNCNADEYKVASTKKCIKCESSDPKCAENQQTDTAVDCTTKVEYWKPHGCYTNRIDSGKVSRGCLQDFDCSANSATCVSCTDTNGCNNAERSSQSCYKCRSDENKECANAWVADAYKSEQCRNSMTVTAESKQCYVENWNGIIIRSCLADADPKARKHCLDANQKTCITCSGDNCNTKEAPNSAYSFALASGLLATSLLVLKFF